MSRLFRLERWLKELSEWFSGAGVTPHLFYDDHYQGDHLALGVSWQLGDYRHPVEHEQCELQVQRTNRGAILRLYAPSVGAITRFRQLINGIHRPISRLANGQRAFFRQLERMADDLADIFSLRQKGYPRFSLSRLGQLFTEAQEAVGVMGVFHEKRQSSFTPAWFSSLSWRQRKRSRHYFTVYATFVSIDPSQMRAVPYEEGRDGFLFPPWAQGIVEQRMKQHPDKSLKDFAISNRFDKNTPAEGWHTTKDKFRNVADPAAGEFCTSEFCCDCDIYCQPCDVCDFPDCSF